MIGIALFGLGRAGKIHAKNIISNPQCQILYAVDPCKEAIENFKTIIPSYLSCLQYINQIDDHSLDGIFKDPKVAAIFVCSATGSHYDLTKRAIENGKAVFCEKPISVDVCETEKLYRLAMQKNIPIHCSFNRRYDPQVRKIFQSLQSGDLGNVHVVKTCSRDHPCPPLEFLRDSGGFFHDCGSHDLDMVCWLLGSMPERVFVTATTHDKAIGELNDVDTAIIVLNFPAKEGSDRPGPMAIIDISRHGCYGYDQRVEVLADKGMIRSENQQASGVVVNAPGNTNSAPIKDSFPQRYDESYVNSLDCFLRTVIEKKPADISAQDVVNISRLAHLCEESYRLGQPVSFTPSKLDF